MVLALQTPTAARRQGSCLRAHGCVRDADPPHDPRKKDGATGKRHAELLGPPGELR
jgi:hypothetical protein